MQVFQTSSASRWLKFKWGSRILMFFGALAITVLVITLIRAYTPDLPRLKNIQYKKSISPQSYVYKSSLIAQQYGGFRKFIDEKTAYQQGKFASAKMRPSDLRFTYQDNKPRDTAFGNFRKFPLGIRSAFYVPWDPQSFYSLQRNISKLNMVIPEWMIINADADTLEVRKDDRAFALMQKAGVKIVPILSNNYKEIFRGDALKRIFNNPAKRERLINDVIKVLRQYQFDGVNVDLEELDQDSDEAFVNFQRDLYTRLHSLGYLVTQDVVPFNDDYDYKRLAPYNDYMFVMAYDQFSDQGQPGPISDQKWIEAAVDDAAAKIPASKMILALAAYGYDWPKGREGESVTYQKALAIAKEEEGTIEFDNDTYNLKFTYNDDNDYPHTVYFTDAATSFNTMRFASEYGLAGVALWRLGSEDSRLWDFYNIDMTKEALQSFSFKEFTTVEPPNDVDYSGDGEVLDVVSSPRPGRITPEIDSAEMLISEETYNELPSMYIVQKYGADTSVEGKKKIVLTFDDGPDAKYTPQILDILSREHVPATFFLVGINAEQNIPLVKRIYREGHEIGNHTFTHPNVAEISTRRAVIEMEATRLLIECITGHSTIMFRAPFNADAEPEKQEELLPVALARTRNYLDIGESIDPEDWQPGVSADTIVARIIARKDTLNMNNMVGNMILLHDAGGNSRAATVAALPRIIEYFKNKGYKFTTVADLLKKKKDDLMPPVPKGSGYYLIQFDMLLAEAGYWIGHVLFALFVVFIVLNLIRLIGVGVLAWKEKRKVAAAGPLPLLSPPPFVSLIVPAYNEEVNAVGSLRNLLRSTYPNLEIIFVDDGSKDATFERVTEAFSDDERVRIFTKPNGGKASALNFGITQSNAAFVVCIDADTKLQPGAIGNLVRHFADSQVGAVAGNVKVGNEVNAITKWQSIEYITGQNFDRRAFSYINAITVVPGAIGAFRKTALEEAGGFTTDTLAEDCDLTIRILRAGWIVTHDNDAIAMTEAPETVKMFLKQRFRWSFGVMQTFYKHRDAIFNNRYGTLGWIALPNILIFQFLIPLFAPIADFFMIVGIVTGNAPKILGYYAAFVLVDLLVGLLAFSFERERMGRLIWLPLQRLIYRWLMLYVLFKSFRKAIQGELQSWGILKRTGKVKEPVMAGASG